MSSLGQQSLFGFQLPESVGMDTEAQVSSNFKYFCESGIVDADAVDLGKIEGGAIDTELCECFFICGETMKLVL